MRQKRMAKGVGRFLAAMLTIALMLGSVSVPVQAATKGYQFTYKKVTVYMGGPAAKLIKKAGEPNSKKESASCAYDGKDRIYTYDDFILYTYSNSNQGKEYINGITFLTSKVKTKEGIKIGSSLKKAQQKYGVVKDSYGIYTYKKGKCKLQLQVTDDKVENIRYVLAD